jgi:hypothetical protein
MGSGAPSNWTASEPPASMEPHPDRWTFSKAHPATQGWGISVIRSGEFPVIARTVAVEGFASSVVAHRRRESAWLAVSRRSGNQTPVSRASPSRVQPGSGGSVPSAWPVCPRRWRRCASARPGSARRSRWAGVRRPTPLRGRGLRPVHRDGRVRVDSSGRPRCRPCHASTRNKNVTAASFGWLVVARVGPNPCGVPSSWSPAGRAGSLRDSRCR